jgi:hypothetical protein
MSTTIRPAFLRPIEFNYSGTAFSVSGGSNYTSFPTGTFANAASFAHSVCATLWNDSVDVALSMSDDLKFKLTPSGSSPTIVWDNTTLRDILGFTGASTALSDGVATEATYTPQYCWFPTYQRSDQGGFDQDLQSVVTGVTSRDGTFSGMGPSSIYVYFTSINFPMEYEEKLFRSAIGSNLFDQARCLETFMRGAIEAMPTLPTSVSPKGFWYYHDVNDLITQTTLTESEPWNETTDNGINFDFTDTENTRAFCATSPREIGSLGRNSPALPVGTLRYNISFSFHTAPVPSGGWKYVDWLGV